MDLSSMNNETLVFKTEKLVREERELLTNVLHHLHEIERRRLFSALGYKSTFDFAVRRLGYAEDQVYRRIAAMRLMFEIPELEEKITAGEISLSHIGLAQTLFRQEKKLSHSEVPREAKLQVLESISNKSVREAERIVLSISSNPELVKPDRIRPISETQVEMKFIATNDLIEKIELLKGRLAHKSPDISLGELFEKLCDLGLTEWNPGQSATSRKQCVKKIFISTNEKNVEIAASRVTNRAISRSTARVAAKTRREVFNRAENRCENCDSTYALEVDHIQPHAHGGSSELKNLRVLCRSCNQRAAIEKLGSPKMDRYLNK